MKNTVSRLMGTLLLAAGVMAGAPSHADSWPERPIHLVVPFAPGGGTDIFTRVMAPRLSEVLGTEIVVENKPGGSSIIGSQQVVQAKPDGYTLLVVDSSIMINPSLQPRLPYNTTEDFTPVVHLASGPVILVINPATPANNLAELVALAKEKPHSLFYGSGGNGASTHLVGEIFNMVADVKIDHVPYKGTGEALTAVIAGHVPMTFTGISSARGPVENNNLRAIAMTGNTRSAAMPEVPTFVEAGLDGVDGSSQWGVFAPRGTPADVVAKLNNAFNEALKDPTVIERATGLGYILAGGTPESFVKFTQAEIDKWRNVIVSAKISIN